MEIDIEIKVGPTWHKAKALLDSGSDASTIHPLFAKDKGLECRDKGPPRARAVDGKEIAIYGAATVQIKAWDHFRRETTVDQTFLSMDTPGVDVILGMDWIVQVNPQIDWQTQIWRYPFDISKAMEVGIEELDKGDTAFVLALTSEGALEPQCPREYAEFADVFSKERAEDLPELGRKTHGIDTSMQEPPYGPVYNLSETELATLREYLQSSERKGWIQRSISPAGAPILFVQKKDGSLRLCVDYRGLNKITVKNRHPLPLITETLDRLQGAKVFTKLDIRNAYHRIRIRPGDEWKTAFRTRYGHFEYKVMPFGLANAPATFQAYMNETLEGLVDTICVVYLDDILIYSSKEEEHTHHVQEVLGRLREANLYVKLSKCEFNTKQVGFLGYTVTTEGVAMEGDRVAAIAEWPTPKTYREVQVFLGFANFYRRFIEQYSSVVAPLTGLMKGAKAGKQTGPFVWGAMQQGAFDRLKEAFTTAPMLVHFDPSCKIRLETDSSGFGLAGNLSQYVEETPERRGGWHPVAFFSKKLEPAELNYEVHDQELLAIVRSFEQWRHYLEGSQHPIEVLTDHNNLKYFMETTALTRRQARWAQALSAYDFQISYRAGKTNPADGPSRRPDYEEEKGSQNVMLPTLRNKLQKAIQAGEEALQMRRVVADLQEVGTTLGEDQSKDTKSPGLVVPRVMVAAMAQGESAYSATAEPLADLIKTLQAADELAVHRAREAGPAWAKGSSGWRVDDAGILRFKGAAYVPPNQAVRMEIFKICHDDPLAGHFGYKKTQELIRRKYYWPGLDQEAREYVRGCDRCQRIKPVRHRPYGEMQGLRMPTKPFESISMDFITDLPPSIGADQAKASDSILVIVDRYTKVSKYIPCRKTITATELGRVFLEYWVKDFGIPAEIITDRGSVFTCHFWSAFCFHLKVRRNLSTAFHPQSDGQTERQNQNIEAYLRLHCNQHQDNWVELLHFAELTYNNAFHDSIQMSPNQARYGINIDLRQGIEDDPMRREVPVARDRVQKILDLRKELEEAWARSKEAQVRGYNKIHKPMQFMVGERVWLSAKNIRTTQPSRKLGHRWLGPYEITGRIGKQAYRLRLPPRYKAIHDVFHVSLLERYREGVEKADPPPDPEIVDGEEEYKVEAVLDHRTVRRGRGIREEYLIRWAGYTAADDQWVPKLDVGLPLIKAYHKEQTQKAM
ncbi:hypothetical protein VC83_09660 [Pseudogymnoascus destructans]|uniref:RNA-directed DNA polymerase n=1 Tax=Pseudogymnoascus destructans TaxID=655981 RepID=A0A2P6FGN1_9PEZI|nr:uncharacterized protein VC83_09601 [Pseudogymnoascus destructans]XP_024328841.1 uncharacterized protein VC83_09660 [Pseudogymnoascus destructans]PQM43474.1 hypothetical protein VC83_09601 [Pseudogymnoascus destructans]PQM43533.1 hypothetical protein VC83_09660 [Pseudogymnoascus destructans]